MNTTAPPPPEAPPCAAPSLPRSAADPAPTATRCAAPDPDACFDAKWLRLRNPADARARSTRLAGLARDWLETRARRSGSASAEDAPRAPLNLADLGCGSGANVRYLAPRLPGPQHWLLVDHDAALLALAAEACATLASADGQPLRCTLRESALQPLAPDAFAGLDLVSASALIDLMSAAWLEDFASACAHAGCACLVSLSVDGTWAFDGPADADDALVRDAFNAHQRRDKGVGGALGPDATARIAERLQAVGFVVTQAPSPWRLTLDDPTDRALADRLLAGWRAAASEQRPTEAARIAAWHARRAATLETAGARLQVGHVDLFACPAPGDPPSAAPDTPSRAAP